MAPRRRRRKTARRSRTPQSTRCVCFPQCHNGIYMRMVTDRLMEFFRPYMERASAGRSFNWRSVRHSKRYLRRQIEYNQLADFQHADFVVSLFQRYGCTSSSLVNKWLRKFCKLRFLNYGYKMASSVPSKAFDLIHEPSDPQAIVRIPSYEYSIVKFSIRRLLLKPFLLKDEKLVRRLLTYTGIRSNCMKRVNVYCYMMDVVHRIQEDPLLEDQITIFGGERQQLEITTSENRLKIILLGIDVVLQMRKGEQNDLSAVRSLQMIFKALKQPYITSREMAHILDLILEGPNKEELIHGFCNDFLVLFPRAEEHYQPRSLKHLARCKIRSQLRKRKTLCYGVTHLDLPKCLQNYLLLQAGPDLRRRIRRTCPVPHFEGGPIFEF